MLKLLTFSWRVSVQMFHKRFTLLIFANINSSETAPVSFESYRFSSSTWLMVALETPPWRGCYVGCGGYGSYRVSLGKSLETMASKYFAASNLIYWGVKYPAWRWLQWQRWLRLLLQKRILRRILGYWGWADLYIIWNYKIKRIWPEDIFTFTRMVTIFIPLTLN